MPTIRVCKEIKSGYKVVYSRLVPRWGMFGLFGYVKADWRSLNCQIHRREVELNRLSKEILKVAQLLREDRKTLKEEIKQIQKSTEDKLSGVTDYYLTTVSKSDLKFVQETWVPKPEAHYRDVIKKEVIDGSKGSSGIFEKAGELLSGAHGTETKFVPPINELREGFSIGYEDNPYSDHVVLKSKSNEEKSSRNKRNNSDAHWKNRVKGENDKEYQDRTSKEMTAKEYYGDRS